MEKKEHIKMVERRIREEEKKKKKEHSVKNTRNLRSVRPRKISEEERKVL